MNPIDKLNEYKEHLNSLMDNSEPELESWHMAVCMACRRIGDMASTIDWCRKAKFYE